MMNTIEYRVDCQLLQFLHEENNLGHRWAVLVPRPQGWWPRFQPSSGGGGLPCGEVVQQGSHLQTHTPRFPIGKTEQVKQWPQDRVHAFWRRWYFPANATLYIVGDLDRWVVVVRE